MPKIKKNIDNDKNKYSSKKRSKRAFKFDIKKILKERQADKELCKQRAESDEQMKVVDDLFQEADEQNIFDEDEDECSVALPKLGLAVFDRSKYNTLYDNIKDNSDTDVTKSYSQQLFIMSIEKNELLANIHFNELLNADWSPVIDDVKNILFNWGANLDTLLNKPQLECQIDDKEKIGRHNFELVFDFLSHSILENMNEFSNDDLLTLAKFTVTISFDHFCGRLINVIKNLFRACIETAFCKDDETSIIAFAQELYSQHKEDDLDKMVIDLFLPLNGHTMEKIYSYLTFKLYKSLLGKNDNLNPFPSSINDWFVQDLVDKNYFNNNSKKVLHRTVRLLQHIVVVFDLYKDEEKLSSMYDFLYAATRSTGPLESLNIINILDQWRLALFRLHINRISMLI